MYFVYKLGAWIHSRSKCHMDEAAFLNQYLPEIASLAISTCAMVKSRYIGDGHPTFNRNPYNGAL